MTTFLRQILMARELTTKEIGTIGRCYLANVHELIGSEMTNKLPRWSVGCKRDC